MRKFGKEKESPGDGERRKGGTWLRDNRCALFVCAAVLIALILRTVFAYGTSAGNAFALSGGSSAQYHLHIVESIRSGASVIGTDMAINYPAGGLNVFAPLYDYIAAGVASVLSAAGVASPASASLAVLAPIFGALTCIPVFLIGNELYGKKAGVLAAFLMALFALPICSTVFSNGTEYAFTAFLVAFFIWAFIKVVKGIDEGAMPLKYVIVSGVLLGLVALSWNGFRIMLVMIVVVMMIQLVLDRFNSKDMTIALNSFAIVMVIGVVIAALYYIPAGLWSTVFSGPALIAIVSLVFAYVFFALKAKPWIFVIPGLIIAFVALSVILYFAAPELCNALLVGNSLFVNSMMESLANLSVTISKMSSYYGWLTMWLPFMFGLYELYIYAMKDRSTLQLFKSFGMLSLWMLAWTSYASAAVSGFVFAVGSAAAIVFVVEHVDYKQWVANIKAAGFPGCFKKLIKPLPFLTVLIAAFLIVVPNVSFAVDAGMPSNNDNDYYFSGNTQFVIETGDSYPYSYIWNHYDGKVDGQSIVTWIDEASGAVANGGFSAVNDQYGTGASAAAHIYLANGNAGSLSASIVRIAMSASESDVKTAFGSTYSTVCDAVLGYIKNPSSAQKYVVDESETFGKVSSSISGENAVYLASINEITTNMSLGAIMDVYQNLRNATGKSIDYIMVDGSMLNLMYGDGSELSTIAYFAGYTVDSYGAANQFVSYPYISMGYRYAYCTDAMYDTFIWKAIVGMTPSEAGYSTSFNYLADLSVSDGKVKAMPGAGLSGYEVDSWIVKYNSEKNATSTTPGWEYMTQEDAVNKQKVYGGTINYLSSIVVMHYVGITDSSSVSSKVVDASGNPISGVTVKAKCFNPEYECLWTYSETKTDSNGNYILPIPSDGREVTITLEYGGLVIDSSDSKEVSSTTTVAAVSFDANIIVDGFVYDTVNYALELKLDSKKYVIQSANGHLLSTDARDETGELAIILPGKYTYQLLDTTGTAVASGSMILYPGENSGLNITPKAYTITATVNDEYGHALASGEFIAVNSYTGEKFYATISEGKAVATVISGTYTVDLGEGYVCTSTTSLTVTSNKTVTITAYNGVLVDFSGYIPEGMILYAHAGTYSTVSHDGKVMFPTSDGATTYRFSVYGVSGDKVYYGLCDNGTISVSSAKACAVSGKLSAEGTISFITDNNSFINAYTDKDGNYSILLPAGTLMVSANNGSNKAYIGSTEITGPISDLNFELENGRKISYTYQYASGTSRGNTGLAYVPSELNFRCGGANITLTYMTGTDGKALYYIPSSSTDITISFNGGSISNEAFHSNSLSKTIDKGTTSSYGDITLATDSIKKHAIYTEYPTMKLKAYGSEDEFEFNSGDQLSPGQYTATLEAESGYVYSGSVYVYPGQTKFNGFKPTEVYVVKIESSTDDVVTVTKVGDTGSYSNYKEDYYYFEKGGEYLVTCKCKIDVNGKSTEKIKYAHLVDENSDIRTLSMHPTAESVTLKGYAGVSGSGTLYVSYKTEDVGEVKLTATISSGTYSLAVPANITNFTVKAKVTNTISSEKYGYEAERVFASMDSTISYNIPVVSIPQSEVENDSKVVAYIEEAVVMDGKITLKVAVKNNSDYETTYIFTSGSAWSIDKDSLKTVTVKKNETNSVIITGNYNKDAIGIGSTGMTLVVSDYFGSNTATVRIIQGEQSTTTSQISVLKKGGELDKISGTEYSYAVTLVNEGQAANVTLTISGLQSGYTYRLSNAEGSIIYSGTSGVFAIAPCGKTVIYVKVIKDEGNMEQPPNVNISVAGSEFTLEPSVIDIGAGSMNVSGDNAFDKRSSIPSGVWFLIAISILLVILIVWMGSKRGVFSRK